MNKLAGASALLALSLGVCTPGQAALDREEADAIASASCEELVEVYRELTNADQELRKALQDSRDETIATNVVGVATLATLGIGFFSWEDTSDLRALSSEVQEYMNAIKAAAVNKKCPQE